LDTTPVTPQGQGGPIELKNLAKRVTEQLQVAGTDKRSCAALAEQIDDLVDDNEFWRLQAHSLVTVGVPTRDDASGNGTREDREGTRGGRSSTLFTRPPLDNPSGDRLDPDDVIDDRFDPGHVFRGDARRTALLLV